MQRDCHNDKTLVRINKTNITHKTVKSAIKYVSFFPLYYLSSFAALGHLTLVHSSNPSIRAAASAAAASFFVTPPPFLRRADDGPSLFSPRTDDGLPPFSSSADDRSLSRSASDLGDDECLTVLLVLPNGEIDMRGAVISLG